MFIEDLKKNLNEIIGRDNAPIAVFSALWPLLRASRLPGDALSAKVLGALKDIAGDRTLLMPAFAAGFRDGVCNLDESPSQTGALSEYFRTQDDTRRTVCPFFSFAVSGKYADEMVALRPKDAWGQGSLYEWMYNNNVRIVTIGTHPTHCSFTHYAEWLMREHISYRYSKEFSGNIIHEGKSFDVKFNMFVRCLEPSVENDFTWLLGEYKKHGMDHRVIDGVSISAIDARAKIDLITEIMQQDPLALVKNRHEFEGERKNG